MKKLLILLVSLLILFSSCDITITGETTRDLCGDSICQIGESCSCKDCIDQDFCKEKEQINCNDNNICTKDIYNKDFDKCEYQEIKPCCGDNFCEESEKCNPSTYETVCPQDCKIKCPALIEISNVKCGDNCKKTDKFTITDTSYLTIELKNIGEESTKTVNGKFDCESELRSARIDYDKIFGVSFDDYFENQQEKISGISGKSKATYKLNFDLTEIEKDFEADCVVILDSNVFTEIRSFKVLFKKL